MSNLFIRIICAFLIGLILIIWPDVAMIYLVSLIGTIFSICGIWSLFGYYLNMKTKKSNFPIWGLLSLIFGIWLIISPVMFVGILMYILGTLLIIAGVYQITTLYNVKKWGNVSFSLYILPILIILSGILIIINPFKAATIPFVILGISCFIYSISEIINTSKINKTKDRYES